MAKVYELHTPPPARRWGVLVTLRPAAQQAAAVSAAAAVAVAAPALAPAAPALYALCAVRLRRVSIEDDSCG
ncbi:hypothetical protein ABWJ92_34005 [Streptomyces sp. NPDC000609]|uniref:hypothetical protein n=1 Tax=Streptomyces sp. NPDC000609 TaxID=3160957 RepID=UPI003394F70D